MFRASTAHSGRNSSEFRRVVRGSECASQRIQKRFRKRLRIRLQIRLQSRERSGAKRRGSERSRRSAHGPPWPQLSTAFPSAYQPARRCSALQPLTLAGILPNSGAPFAALNARPNAFRNGFGTAFRAASEAARSAAGASGPGVLHTARRGHNCPRHFATYVSAEDGAVRSNRSLWPSFSPNDGASFAALKARPNAFRNGFGTAFRAASGAARSAAGASGPGAPHTARRGHNCPRHFATHVSPQVDVPRFNRSLWPEFFRIPARRSRL
jgi:hypothetical protein